MTDELDVLLDQVQQHIDSVGTLIHIVLDESGSMGGQRLATIEGFNKLIEDQRAEPGKAWVSLTFFSTTVRNAYTALPLDRVQPMTNEDYVPQGGTALLDAQGVAIEATAKWLEETDEKPDNIIIITMTDGGENSSRDFTADQIKKLISLKEDEGWDFVYTGANQDAFQVGNAMGYGAKNVANFNAANMTQTMGNLSRSLASYRGAAAQAVMTNTEYSTAVDGFWKDDDEA